MKPNLLLAAFLIFGFSAFAQAPDTTQAPGLEHIVKIEGGLQGVGLGYELPLHKKWSVNLSAGLGGGNSVYGNHFKSTWVLNDPVTYFRSEFRYTYNRDKRLSKSKSMLSNTGNYVAFQTKYTTRRVFGNNSWYGEDFLNRTLLNEVHWGIQRPLGQKFIFNFHLGLGYAADLDFNEGQVYPSAGVQFAYILSKRK